MISSLEIEVDKKEMYIEMSGEFTDPIVAAQVTEETTKLLQNAITNIKIKKAKTQLKFIKKRYKEKKARFEKIQKI